MCHSIVLSQIKLSRYPSLEKPLFVTVQKITQCLYQSYQYWIAAHMANSKNAIAG